MKIAIDAMGGDNAPLAIIDGISLFLKEFKDVELILVGQKDLIVEHLRRVGLESSPKITIEHADEVIGMGDSPVKALRVKKSASMVVMMDLLKEGKVDGVLSAGNTGGVVAAATLKLRTLKNIDRPGIATVIPTPYGRNILMDVGAVSDCKPKNLFQFAIMGMCMSKFIMGIDNPTVGLLNVGEEDSKGNELTKEAFAKLKESKLNFIGNVEGKDIFKSTANVIVTDGFVGNVVLKACESLAKGLFSVIKKEIKSSFFGLIGGLLLKKPFGKVLRQFDYEEYGGALLLGVNGVVIISHGSSSPWAIRNAINVAVKMVKSKVNEEISKKLEIFHD
ncbi:MAG: hypothetical protein ACD_79C00663G0001 [uncultured bacterium]|nr:MAG: hypothetical protein ACD_79C00663G0001 [uncultured bacterium]